MGEIEDIDLLESRAFLLFEQKDFSSARQIFVSLKRLTATNDENHPKDCLFNVATCKASEGNYGEALKIFEELSNDIVINNDLMYNKALCYYFLSDLTSSQKCIDQLLENCRRIYPELFAQATEDSHDELMIDDRLEESCFIEAINLKSAILFKLNKSLHDSSRCLDGLPIKDLAQLDCVSLHNKAIYEFALEIESSIHKVTYLTHLLGTDGQQFDVALAEMAFQNAIILYLISGQSKEAAEYLSSNKVLLMEFNPQAELRLNFLQLLVEIHCSSIVNESMRRKLETLLDQLYEATREPQNRSKYLIDLLETVLTYHGSILWSNSDYDALEKHWLRFEPQLGTSNLWRKNMAHILYVMDSKFEECSRLYEELLPKSEAESLLSVDPMVLGNLCVSYVLTSQNKEAEALIKEVEAEVKLVGKLDAQQMMSTNHDRDPTHLCVINLVVSTLYCVKSNYNFGLVRIFKSLEPIERHLHPFTWFHAKRCILSLLDNHCKQMIYANDDLLDQIVAFLIQSEQAGNSVQTLRAKRIDSSSTELTTISGRTFVTHEARYLRSILLDIIHN